MYNIVTDLGKLVEYGGSLRKSMSSLVAVHLAGLHSGTLMVHG